MLSSVEEGLEDIRQGKIIIVIDDENRENEGDFIIAGEKITPEKVNFMIIITSASVKKTNKTCNIISPHYHLYELFILIRAVEFFHISVVFVIWKNIHDFMFFEIIIDFCDILCFFEFFQGCSNRRERSI